MFINQIGEAAGLIWRALDSQGPLKLPALKKKLKVNDTMLHMAVGWLAREDKIEVEPRGRSYVIQLK